MARRPGSSATGVVLSHATSCIHSRASIRRSVLAPPAATSTRHVSELHDAVQAALGRLYCRAYSNDARHNSRAHHSSSSSMAAAAAGLTKCRWSGAPPRSQSTHRGRWTCIAEHPQQREVSQLRVEGGATPAAAHASAAYAPLPPSSRPPPLAAAAPALPAGGIAAASSSPKPVQLPGQLPCRCRCLDPCHLSASSPHILLDLLALLSILALLGVALVHLVVPDVAGLREQAGSKIRRRAVHGERAAAVDAGDRAGGTRLLLARPVPLPPPCLLLLLPPCCGNAAALLLLCC